MSTYHTVKPGEDIFSLALQYGLRNWEKIWLHTDNQELRARRKNPGILHEGDQVFIPDKEAKTVQANTDAGHVFKVSSPEIVLRMIVKDQLDSPMASCPFELYVEGTKVLSDTTGADGLIETPIAADATTGELRVFPDDERPSFVYQWKLNFGCMDPIEESRGVQARLRNLGYPCGPIDGQIGTMTRRAVSAFQLDIGMEATGEADDVTRQRLLALHDEA